MAELKDLLDFAAEQGVHAIEVTLLQETLQEIERLQAQLAVCEQKHADNQDEIHEERMLVERLKDEKDCLSEELAQAKPQQVHCMACGGVECHRLAEIVQLTGMESDQHLVEWVEQAKAEIERLRDTEHDYRVRAEADWDL